MTKKQPTEQVAVNPLREALRAKMAAAGILGSVELPPDMSVPTPEEVHAAQQRTAELTARHGGLRMDEII